MTAAKDLREAEDDFRAYAPQPGPAPSEPHGQRTLLARIGQLETALAAGERREHALQSLEDPTRSNARPAEIVECHIAEVDELAHDRAAPRGSRCCPDVWRCVARGGAPPSAKDHQSGGRCISQRRIPGCGRFVYTRAMRTHRKALPAPRAPGAVTRVIRRSQRMIGFSTISRPGRHCWLGSNPYWAMTSSFGARAL